ncbi:MULTISPECIES: hypothetical protein [Chryseobacterium]|uniref:Uncharacterized protein n=1 Tax=Chryseobacterium indoltheticum TaxID=254 RepID=A0A381FBM7_9FLAO|nr:MULTISPECIES: hypothetical protein [Chryseobacterium]AZA73730.1 hypothetical protein EG358_08175 [Chryseobacterium indoltheticum]SIQ93201.1 hypothetical protein SAMN05421682_11069 [Chryseobacterium indoltheticum]SUX43873.1 Uncharacterised protein [Chryseobacterium indoltheticum]
MVPVNKQGSENDVSAFLICESETEEFDQFKKLSNNLLNINDWNVIAGKNPVESYIDNKNQSQLIQENDLAKIKIPKKENKMRNGFAWVQVQKIQIIETEDLKIIVLQMKPHS